MPSSIRHAEPSAALPRSTAPVQVTHTWSGWHGKVLCDDNDLLLITHQYALSPVIHSPKKNPSYLVSKCAIPGVWKK